MRTLLLLLLTAAVSFAQQKKLKVFISVDMEGIAGVVSPDQLAPGAFEYERLRYDKMAEGLGARGEYVTTPDQMKQALSRAYKAAATESASTLINVQALKEFTSGKDYAPGIALPTEPGVGAFAH